uniref:Uncharacterized protein n=1 Tax=Oryza glumipatula TaxID=40148 RepID=A0A0E0B5W4_9ORYZ
MPPRPAPSHRAPEPPTHAPLPSCPVPRAGVGEPRRPAAAGRTSRRRRACAALRLAGRRGAPAPPSASAATRLARARREGGVRTRRLLRFLRLLVPLGRRGHARVVARAGKRVGPISGADDAYARWDAVVGCWALAEKYRSWSPNSAALQHVRGWLVGWLLLGLFVPCGCE